MSGFNRRRPARRASCSLAATAWRRLPQQPGADASEVRCQPFQRRSRFTTVPNRGSGAASRRWKPRVSGPFRRPGQDPGAPDRAGRDRSGAAAAPHGAPNGGGCSGAAARREAACGLRRSRELGRLLGGRVEAASRRTLAALHGSRPHRANGPIAFESERQGGPFGSARAGSTEAGGGHGRLTRLGTGGEDSRALGQDPQLRRGT